MSEISKQFLSKTPQVIVLFSRMLRSPSEREEEIIETTCQRDGVNQELSQVETKINLALDSLKKKKKEAQGSLLLSRNNLLAGPNCLRM